VIHRERVERSKTGEFIRNTGFGPKGKFRGSEFGLSEKPVNSSRIGAKQIEEFGRLWQKTPVGCHLPFGKTEAPLCSFEAKNFVTLVLRATVSRGMPMDFANSGASLSQLQPACFSREAVKES
jgi:hypothetical protein